MARYTAYDIVKAIGKLPRDRNYYYVSETNKGVIRIEDVRYPEGPIRIKRWVPEKGQTYETARAVPMSSQMIWRIANAIQEGELINFDRILGGSYNTRSVLESLMAATPEFYYCYPGRVEDMDGHTTIKKGHVHLVWLPNEPHEQGKLVEKEMPNMAISEIPSKAVVYDNLVIPENMLADRTMDIAVIRRHTQIQIALYLIGLQLGYRTWIAQNDKGIVYQDRPLIEHNGIIKSLSNEKIISAFDGAEPSARFIDCIWFQNGRFMPAVMEVEHTTGITSGLTRMLGFRNTIPAFQTRYVIVAPDDDRERVIQEVNREEFKCLDARYFSYSAVEELYYICATRHLHGVNQEFLDCYMEKVCID